MNVMQNCPAEPHRSLRIIQPAVHQYDIRAVDCHIRSGSDRNTDIRRPLFNTLAKSGYPILMLRPMDLELEDIFLQLTNERGEE